MIKIGLLGYGKMGKAIETIALEQGHQIVWKIGRDARDTLTPDLLRQAQVVIEFTRPEAAFDNVSACLEAGVPVISGTTGWNTRLPEARALCLARGGAMLWASNFSVGVNLFFAVNQYLAGLMNTRPEYEPSVRETHHVHKLDAPSGTAITITNDILAAIERKKSWVLAPTPPGADEIPVTAVRENEVPGTHAVIWSNAIDEIKLEHVAHTRAGFAAGAVLAATWIVGKTGVFTMREVLGIGEKLS